MIVRIQGEGQYQLPDDSIGRINELDAEVEATLDGDGFSAALGALLDMVRSVGRPVPDEEVVSSEVILPAADASAEEVRGLLTDEGLIPG